MKPKTSFAFLSASVFLFSGCLTGGGGRSSDALPPGYKSASFAYNLEAGKIRIPAATWIEKECGETGLETTTRTRHAGDIPYELDGDSLKLMLVQPQTVEPGVVLQIYNIHVRVGRGTGLQGQWLLVGQRYRMASGEASEAERTRFDGMMASADFVRPFTDFHYLISGDSISTFQDSKSAALFIASWNGLDPEGSGEIDSARYDISLRLVEKHIVELHGLRTGETVRLRIGDDKSLDFASDVPGHAPHHYDDSPESCPNAYHPDWYIEFLGDNRRPIPE